MNSMGDHLLIYVIVEISTVLLYCWCLRMLQNKRGRSAQDGLLVMASWPKQIRHAVSFSLVLLWIVPACVYVITNIGAAFLSLSEGWSFIDSFEYVLCNAIGIGPLNALTTDTVGGQLADVLISVVCLVFFSTVLGLCGSMGLIEDVSDMFGPTKKGGCLAVLVIVILHIILICLCASVLAVIEGYDLWDCILYMAGLLCNIENPLTPFVPRSVEANFFASMCASLEYAVGGAIIGILAMHREMVGFVIKVEGHSTRTRQQMKEFAEDKLHEKAPALKFQSQQSEDMQSKDNDPIVAVCAEDNLSNVPPRSDDCTGADSSASHTLFTNSQVQDLQGELAQAQEDSSSARAEIQRLQRQLQEKDAVINAKLMQAEEADCGNVAEVNRLREQSQENANYALTAPDISQVSDLQRDLKLAQEDNNSAHAEIQRLWGQLQEKDALGAEAARLREELQENEAKTKLARDKHDQIEQQMHNMREKLLALEQAANSKEEDKARSMTRDEQQTNFSQLPSTPSWNLAEGREKRGCCS